jgi:hypothetical protein
MPTGPASGIAVLDLDVKNGKDGLKAVPDWDSRSSVVARTRSGGIHVYFTNDDTVRSQSDQIAPGVDSRAKGGYVIVPPSAGYMFIKGSLAERSALPAWPDDLRPKPRDRTEPPPESNPAKQEAPDRARIVAALKTVSSDCGYQVWFEIGCALAKELGQDGFALFDKWSSKSAKYDANVCRKQWDACLGTEKFTIATLFHHAEEAKPGWRTEFEASQLKPLILTGAEFVDGFVPPDYLIDGVLQKRFLYSMTAPTGTGKTAIALRLTAHVAKGLPLAGREIVEGKVLYFAGENPDDVRTRWIKLCEEMKLDAATTGAFFVAGTFSISKLRQRIVAEAKAHGPFALIVVDTLAAYYEGDEENSNTQMAKNARMMRSLSELDGGPTVIVTCHPTKTPNNDNLLPRGGGAFLAEVDGNLVCVKLEGGVVDLHWQGKFRGPDFPAMPFKITPGTSDQLKDSKGRPIWTVTAAPLSREQREAAESQSHVRQGQLLAMMEDEDGLSLAELAKRLTWLHSNGDPDKGRVNRTMHELHARGLVKKADGGSWSLARRRKRKARDDEPM